MANFGTEGIDELIKYVEGRQDTGDLLDNCLEAAGEELTKAWRNAIASAGHVKTGGLQRSVTVTVKNPKDGDRPYVMVYPKGRAPQTGKKQGTAYRYIAFVLNYGRGGKAGSRFKEKAENAAMPKIEARWAELWKRFWS